MSNGMGRAINSQGGVYDGQWLNDKAHGYGKYHFSNGTTYSGQWVDDSQTYGTELKPDGSKYTGKFEEGQKHDLQGEFIMGDGSLYVGGFAQNAIHGDGKYVQKDGTIYDGSWKQNKMDGKGV